VARLGGGCPPYEDPYEEPYAVDGGGYPERAGAKGEVEN